MPGLEWQDARVILIRLPAMWRRHWQTVYGSVMRATIQTLDIFMHAVFGRQERGVVERLEQISGSLERQPEAKLRHRLLFQYFSRAGLHRLAVKHLEFLGPARLRGARARYRAAASYFDVGEYSKVLSMIQSSSGRLEGHAAALNLLGLTYQKLGKVDDAERCLAEAIENSDSALRIKCTMDLYRFYRGTGARQKATDLVLNLEAKLMALRLPECVEICRALHGWGDYELAIPFWKRALGMQRGRSDIHEGLAIAYQESGLLEAALQEHQTAVQKNPNDTVALFNLGVVQKALGDYDSAKKTFNRLLELEPGDYRARMQLADCWSLDDGDEEALHLYELIPRSAENYWDSQYRMAKLLRSRDVARATNILATIVRNCPDHADARREYMDIMREV